MWPVRRWIYGYTPTASPGCMTGPLRPAATGQPTAGCADQAAAYRSSQPLPSVSSCNRYGQPAFGPTRVRALPIATAWPDGGDAMLKRARSRQAQRRCGGDRLRSGDRPKRDRRLCGWERWPRGTGCWSAALVIGGGWPWRGEVGRRPLPQDGRPPRAPPLVCQWSAAWSCGPTLWLSQRLAGRPLKARTRQAGTGRVGSGRTAAAATLGRRRRTPRCRSEGPVPGLVDGRECRCRRRLPPAAPVRCSRQSRPLFACCFLRGSGP
jgi:hypothetical protein